jgi:hypothetical protein
MTTRCSKCGKDVLDADTLTTRLNDVLSSSDNIATKCIKDAAERGYGTERDRKLYEAGAMEQGIKSFIESLRFACACKAEKAMPRPKSKSTWGTCAKLHKTWYAEGTDPGNCKRCGEPVRTGGVA